jgi:hypothetical protein
MFISDTPTIDDALTFAVDAIDRGDMDLGAAALEWVLERQPKNPFAWLWMACTAPDEQTKRECYLRVEL